MEAAVSAPAAMTDVDCNSNSSNAESEVKKSQELVRKLERQNEQSRSRTGGCLSGGYHHHHHLPGPSPSLLCQASSGTFSPPQEPLEYFHPHAGDEEKDDDDDDDDDEEKQASEPSVSDESELSDSESSSCSEESDETWLYAALKAGESSVESLSPSQWCRQNSDSPKSDVETARRSLSSRLEQVSRWRSSQSTPTTTSPGTPSTRVTSVSSPSAKPCSTPPSTERHAATPFLSSPSHPVLHRTSSPIGKELSPVAERTPTFLLHAPCRSRSLRRSTLSPQSSVDSDSGTSEVEDDSISLGYKLQDLTDVQVMARSQEESLRQDYASTSSVSANRRSQSFTFQLSQLGAGPGSEEEDEDDEDYGLSPPPQPRLTRSSHSHTFSSIHDWRRSTNSSCTPPSTPSTPPYPSVGSAPQVHPPAQSSGSGSSCGGEQSGFSQGSDKLRRSMPNSVRAPSMPSVPIPTTSTTTSASLLRNSQSFDSSSSLARLQSSSQLQTRVQGLGSFSSLSRQPSKATAYVSPTIKGSTSTSLTSSNISGSNSGIPSLSKHTGGGSAPSVASPRSGLPRPASIIGPTSSSPRSKLALSSRSLLTQPRSLSTFSALRDITWRDGCY